MSSNGKKFSFKRCEEKAAYSNKSGLTSAKPSCSSLAASSVSVKSIYDKFRRENNYAPIAAPFIYAEQRFSWHDNIENMRRAESASRISYSNARSRSGSFDGGFKCFYDLSQKHPADETRSSSVKMNSAFDRKVLENKRGVRVVNPKLDKTFNADPKQIKIRTYKQEKPRRSSLAEGSISNLLNKTPQNVSSGGKKIFHMSYLNHVNIFTEKRNCVEPLRASQKKQVKSMNVSLSASRSRNASSSVINRLEDCESSYRNYLNKQKNDNISQSNYKMLIRINQESNFSISNSKPNDTVQHKTLYGSFMKQISKESYQNSDFDRTRTSFGLKSTMSHQK